MNPQDRFKDYQGDKCWQAYISEVNRDVDLLAADLTEEEASMLRTSDFVFEYVNKEDKQLCKEVKEFIMRHEWLAKLHNRQTREAFPELPHLEEALLGREDQARGAVGGLLIRVRALVEQQLRHLHPALLPGRE